MAQLDDKNALLLFRVGPVCCCAPSLPVESVIIPPHLTRPPGNSTSRPGIFKYGNKMVGVVELRYLFGVAKENWQPGRNIIATINNRSFGFQVDDILDVLNMPLKGWGTIPALIPHDVFSRTLLLDDNIYLYTEFEDLVKLNKPGLLKKYIAQLAEQQINETPVAETVKDTLSDSGRNHKAVAENETPHVMITPEPINPGQKTGQATLKNIPPQNDNTYTNNGHQAKSAFLISKQNAEVIVTNDTITRDAAAQTPGINTHNYLEKIKPSTTSLTSNGDKHTDSFSRSPLSKKPQTNPLPHHYKEELKYPEKKKKLSTHNSEKTIQVTRQKHEGSSAWVFIIVFLLILGGAGYFFYDLFYPDKQQKLSSTKYDSSGISTPVKSDPVDEFMTRDAQSSLAIQPENIDNDIITNNMQQSNSAEQLKTPGITNSPEKIVDDTFATEPSQKNNINKPEEMSADDSSIIQQDPVASAGSERNTSTPLHQESPYHAEIGREGNDITIILNAPEQTEPEITTNHDAQTPASLRVDEHSLQTRKSVEIELLKNSETPETKTPVKNKNTSSRHKTEIIHIIVKGDTLWAIAKRYVNNPFRYPELARLSKIRNPDLIYPGNRVRIINYEISNARVKK